MQQNTLDLVPNRPREGRSTRSVRLDDDDWDELGTVAEAMDVDRSWIIRQLVRFYLRRQGAEVPRLPGGKQQ